MAEPCRLDRCLRQRTGVSGAPLVREPLRRAISASLAAGSAGEGSPVPLSGQTVAAGIEQVLVLAPTSCPHRLGKTVRAGSRTAATSESSVGCLPGSSGK